ncbi:hypothetical protein RFF05_02385 [Bengtsoniella intestinalis]|uniref:hypothetical protein n=1 Tax=Bengtsoniella intestinalis TaxID=3073143 RepID=UPI00391F3819
MKILFSLVVFVLMIPLITICLEVFFCKRNMEKTALYFPLVVGAFAVFFGIYALVWMAILYGIYFIDRYLKRQKVAEHKRMNDIDLEDF